MKSQDKILVKKLAVVRGRDRPFCGGLLAVDACPHQPQPALPEALWDSVQLSRDEFLSHMAALPLAPPHAALNAVA